MSTYARIYQSVRDDEKFVGIFEDESAFGSWVKLLLNAERDWPAPSDIPSWCKPKTLDLLVARGIVEPINGSRYKIVGLDAERARRSQRATESAEARWRPNVTPDVTIGTNSEDPAVVYGNLCGGFPGPKAVSWLDDLSAKYGSLEVCKALGLAAQQGTSGVIGRAQDALRAQARELANSEKKAEQAKVAQRRLDGMTQRRLEYFEQTGKWDDGWGEKPQAA